MFMEMSKIENVVKQAILTFNATSKIDFSEMLNKLTNLTSQLTLSDVYLNVDLILNHEHENRNKRNPLIFIPVFQNNDIQCTIFILKSKSKIMLHDHPVMHGIIKVLSGKLLIQSYSSDESNIDISQLTNSTFPYKVFPLPVNKHSPIIVGDQDKCVVVTPTVANFHEVTSYDGPTAFFDILSPPYSTPFFNGSNLTRKCTYYKEMKSLCYNEKHSLLRPYQNDPDFWCIEMTYEGPEIQTHDEYNSKNHVRK